MRDEKKENGIPYGIRTRVARSKIWSPKPLDEGDADDQNQRSRPYTAFLSRQRP